MVLGGAGTRNHSQNQRGSALTCPRRLCNPPRLERATAGPMRAQHPATQNPLGALKSPGTQPETTSARTGRGGPALNPRNGYPLATFRSPGPRKRS